MSASRALLLVSPSDYESAVRKGVSALLDDFHEAGFFARTLVCFPLTARDQRLRISARTEVLEWGIIVRSRRVRRLLAPFHVIRCVLRIARLVRQESIDVVRATDPCFSGLLAWAGARLAGRPFCVSIHADYDKRHALDPGAGAPIILGSRRLAEALESFVLRMADHVWPIRESLIPYAVARGASPDRIRVIPHGANLAAFADGIGTEDVPDLPADRHILSFAGRLSHENYVDDLLAIARALGAVRRDFVLVLAGAGAEAERLAQLVAADPVLRDVVRLAGPLRRAQVAGLRRRSLVALALMGGFSLIEAAAAGAALIAYDIEWHREIVLDGTTGRLVPEGDVAAAAAAIAAMLDQPETAQIMGLAAQRLALERHRLETATAHKQRCYEELLTHA